MSNDVLGLFAEELEADCNRSRIVPFPVKQEPSWERDVERVNHYPLYELGKTLRRITEIATGQDFPARDVHHALRVGIDALDTLLRGVPFPLGISKSTVRTLRAEMWSVYEAHFISLKNGRRIVQLPEDNRRIDSWELFSIRHELAKFETIFSTEMGDLATYFVPQRGIYSTAALIDFADQTFPSGLYGQIPEKAKDEWRAAGRCLAFNLLTATGFHVARAVEATLEVYYQLYTGKSKTLHGWNDYIKALEGVAASGSDPSPTPKTLAELTQMKDDYRNPMMHPRVSLSESDARMLFDNGESLIIAMADEIKTLREVGGVQGTLAVVGGASVVDLDDEIPF